MTIEEVYTPREDSYLLKNYLKNQKILKNTKTLDLGTGSGIIALEMARKGANVTATDINQKALRYAERQAKKQKLENKIEFKKSDIYSKVEKEYDLITFNPPYLPSSKQFDKAKTWQGGQKGTEITERMLKQTKNYLKKEGEAIIILSNKANSHEIIEKYDLDVIESKKVWFEKLVLAKYR